MDQKTCSHLANESIDHCFKIIDEALVMCCVCEKCKEEFFRPANNIEINRAKELGIIK